MTQRTVFTAFNRRRATAALGAALLAASLSPLAHAQDTRPARLLLGFPAGGSFDAIARLFGRGSQPDSAMAAEPAPPPVSEALRSKIVLLVEDISARREAEARYRTLVEHAPELALA